MVRTSKRRKLEQEDALVFVERQIRRKVRPIKLKREKKVTPPEKRRKTIHEEIKKRVVALRWG